MKNILCILSFLITCISCDGNILTDVKDTTLENEDKEIQNVTNKPADFKVVSKSGNAIPVSLNKDISVHSYSPLLAVASDKLHCYWYEYNDYTIYERSYNGDDTNPSWTDPSSLSFPGNVSEFDVIADDNNSYVMAKCLFDIYISKCENGTPPCISIVQSGKINTNNASSGLKIIFSGPTLYAAWIENNGSSYVHMARYEGNNIWALVNDIHGAGINDTGINISSFTIVGDGSKIYAALVEGTAAPMTLKVRSLEKGQWSTEKSNLKYFSNNVTIDNPEMQIYNEKLLISWKEKDSGTSYQRMSLYSLDEGFIDGNGIGGFRLNTDDFTQNLMSPYFGFAPNGRPVFFWGEISHGNSNEHLRGTVVSKNGFIPIDNDNAWGLNYEENSSINSSTGSYHSMVYKNKLYLIFTEVSTVNFKNQVIVKVGK